MDFARAYDSILHMAILRAMRRRSVPEPLGTAYIQKTRRAIMAFEHFRLVYAASNGWCGTASGVFGGTDGFSVGPYPTVCQSCTKLPSPPAMAYG